MILGIDVAKAKIDVALFDDKQFIAAGQFDNQNMDHFDHSGQVVAYAGLSPQQHNSGSSVHKPTRLTKTGNQSLKTALYFPAITAIRYNPIVKALAARLESRGKAKMVIIGVAMRKLLQLAYGVLKSGRPFDPHYAANSQGTP